jgi:hypothetical protein
VIPKIGRHISKLTDPTARYALTNINYDPTTPVLSRTTSYGKALISISK